MLDSQPPKSHEGGRNSLFLNVNFLLEKNILELKLIFFLNPSNRAGVESMITYGIELAKIRER